MIDLKDESYSFRLLSYHCNSHRLFEVLNPMSREARFHQTFVLDDHEGAQIYNGYGTEENPFLVEFKEKDPLNPMNWSQARKWFITTIVTLSVFVVTFTSSAYAESADEVIQDFAISSEVFIIGVSLFVLGFAVGPCIWGPLVSA